jgi:hypothetical protein
VQKENNFNPYFSPYSKVQSGSLGLIQNLKLNQEWWHIPVLQALGRQRQEVMSLRPSWAT